MVLRVTLFFGMFLSATACNFRIQSPPTLAARDVIGRMVELNGKDVKVVGYMPRCAEEDCTLFASKADYDAFAEDRTQKFLSIGYDKDFDRRAGPLAGRVVAVTGRISTDCWPMGCLDRSPDIVPQGIEAWDAPMPAVAARTR